MSVPQTLLADRYRLVRVIATGGMGVVWEAWDERLQRPVAIKELRTEAGVTDEEAEQAKNRAMREARITARLHHPHAVPVFDAVEHEGRPCLIMQYLPSTPLSAILRQRGRLEPHEVARFGAEIASALAAAHKLKIVHRDVKPGNILITEEGTAHISDFGISHALGDATLTRTGMVYGTPAYLAPEVARGAESTYASDVFSLGSTLYAALEGQPPFGADPNSIALLHRVASGNMTPPQHAGVLTPFLLDMLAPEPKQRPSMKAIASLLAGLQKDVGSDKPTQPIPPQSSPAVAGAGVALQAPISETVDEPTRAADGGGLPWPFSRKRSGAADVAAAAGGAAAGAAVGAAAAGAAGADAAGAGAAGAATGLSTERMPEEPTVAASSPKLDEEQTAGADEVAADQSVESQPTGSAEAERTAEVVAEPEAELEPESEAEVDSAGADEEAEAEALVEEDEAEAEPALAEDDEPEPEPEPALEPEAAEPEDSEPGVDAEPEVQPIPEPRSAAGAGLAAVGLGAAAAASAAAAPASAAASAAPDAPATGEHSTRVTPTVPAPTTPAPTVSAPTRPAPVGTSGAPAGGTATATTSTVAGGGLPPDRARRRGGILILLLVAAVVLAALFLVPAVLDGRFGQGAQGGPDTAGNPASSEPEEQGSEGSEGSGAGAGAGEEEPSPEPTEEPEPSEKPTKEPKEEKPEEEEKEDDEEPDPEDREQATTPEGAVAGYYALLPGDTDEAWDRLTADYQNGEAQNREYYEEFWDRFDDVSVSEIDPISATEVEATVTYIYDDGSQESERRYYRFVEEDGILKIDASST